MTQKRIMDGKAPDAESAPEDEGEQLGFEDALRDLEEAVRTLESGDLPLEDAFKRFEDGVRLSKLCRERLDGLEARVAELLDSGETRSLTPDAATE